MMLSMFMTKWIVASSKGRLAMWALKGSRRQESVTFEVPFQIPSCCKPTICEFAIGSVTLMNPRMCSFVLTMDANQHSCCLRGRNRSNYLRSHWRRKLRRQTSQTKVDPVLLAGLGDGGSFSNCWASNSAVMPLLVSWSWRSFNTRSSKKKS